MSNTTNNAVQANSTNIRNFLSPSGGDSITFNGRTYTANNHHITYNIASFNPNGINSLVDGGANGGLAGEDVRILETSDVKIMIQGIDNHKVHDLNLVQAAGLVKTTTGPVVVILNQYANIGKGKSIHSKIQMEAYGLDVDDKSQLLPNGKQRIKTPDGYILPLQVKHGLAYLPMRPPSDAELENLPHILLTSDDHWDPTIFDNEIDPEEWFDCQEIPEEYDDLTIFGNWGI